MKKFLGIAFWLLLAFAGTTAQTPGTLRYPNQLDTNVSLFEVSNLASTALTASVTNSATTVSVTSTTGFPTTGSITLSGTEIAYYTGKTSTTFTGLIRGQDGTTPTTHSAGGTVRQNIIARHITVLRDAILALQAKLGADTGTTLTIGGAVPLGIINYDLRVSSATNKPAIRYNPSSAVWQFSNDGSTFVNFGGAGLTSLNGQSGSTQTFAVTFAGTGSNPAFTSSGNVHTLNIPEANGGQPYGLVTNTTQQFRGRKDFINGAVGATATIRLAGDASEGAISIVNAGTPFKVDYTGDITYIKSVPYQWPTTQATEASVEVLTNSGTGVLFWNRPKIKVQDEGTDVNSGIAKINFTGAGVSATLDAGNGRINVDIPGGGSSFAAGTAGDLLGYTGTSTAGPIELSTNFVIADGTLKAKGLQEAINARLDYAAAGDGLASDTAALQNTINAAAGSAKKIAYIPAGTYLVTTLNLPDDVHVRGDGKGRTIIKSTSNAAIITVPNTAYKTRIEDLDIQGSVSAGSSQICVNLAGSGFYYGVTLKNVQIRDCGSHGLFVKEAYSSTFEDIYLDNTAGYPLLYDGFNRPGNRFKNVYVGFVRSSAPVGFRIKSGEFVCDSCNGINNVVAGSKWAVIGRKNGVDGDAANEAAQARWNDANIEAWVEHGLLHYSNSQSSLEGYTTFAASGVSDTLNGGINNSQTSLTLSDATNFTTTSKIKIDSEILACTGKTGNQLTGCSRGQDGTSAASHSNGATVTWRKRRPVEYELDSGSNPAFFQRGYIADTVKFGDGPETNYDRDSAIWANDVPPLQTLGVGPFVASGAPLFSYWDSTNGRVEPLPRADGLAKRFTITGSRTFNRPGIRYIEANCSAACTITLPWAGWYRTHEPIVIKDVSGAAATNNITVSSGGGGTVNGSSFTINGNGQAITLMPNEGGSGDWRVVGNTAAGISGSGTSPRLAVWSSSSGQTSYSGLEWDNGNNALKSPGRFWAANNSAGAPAFAFTNDFSTGIYLVSANTELGLAVNGGQKVGIGTSSSFFATHLTPDAADTRDLGSSSLPWRTGYFRTSLALGTGSNKTGQLILNNSTNGNTTTFQAGAAASNLLFTTPTADGSNGQFMSTNGSGALSFANCCSGQWAASSGTGAQTIDWTTTGTTATRQFTVTSNSSVSFTFTAPRAGTVCTLIFIRDATGTAAVNWPASVKWPGGSSFPPTTGANAKDVFTFFYDGTNYLYQINSSDVK